jgi:hypothetical protein
MKILQELSLYVQVLALESGFWDFEDATLYLSAINEQGREGIVPRNRKDFNKRRIPVLSPHEALAMF